MGRSGQIGADLKTAGCIQCTWYQILPHFDVICTILYIYHLFYSIFSTVLQCALHLFYCTVYSIYSSVLFTLSILPCCALHLFYCTTYSIYSTVLCTPSILPCCVLYLISILLYCMYFVIHSTVLSAPSIFKSILCTVLSTVDSIYSARWFHVFPVS